MGSVSTLMGIIEGVLPMASFEHANISCAAEIYTALFMSFRTDILS